MLTGRLLGGTSVTSSASKRTAPLVGVSTPARIFSKVVLPAPVGPRRQTKVPSSISRLTSSSAVFFPYSLVTLSSLIPRIEALSMLKVLEH